MPLTELIFKKLTTAQGHVGNIGKVHLRLQAKYGF